MLTKKKIKGLAEDHEKALLTGKHRGVKLTKSERRAFEGAYSAFKAVLEESENILVWNQGE